MARPAAEPSGLRPSRQDEAIVEAAWCYFHEGMNQSDIALHLGVSRASVVNYLAEARRRNYVRISLDTSVFRHTALADRLRDAFGLTDVLVIPADPLDEARSLERTVRAASDWLADLLEPGDMLGVAWGETVYKLAEAAPSLSLPDLTVVQLVGSRPAAMGFAAETCSVMLAHKFGAACVNLHVPMLLSSAELCDQLRAEPVVREQLEAVANCNKVIFACGTCQADSHIAQTGLATADELAHYRAQGAAGVICGRLIDTQGAPLPIKNEDRMIGVALEDMRGKEMGLLVTSGRDRPEAAKAAILGGYVTHFATCSATAERLLDIA